MSLLFCHSLPPAKTVVEQLAAGHNLYMEKENSSTAIANFTAKYTSPPNLFITATTIARDNLGLQPDISKITGGASLTVTGAAFVTFYYRSASLSATYYSGSSNNGGNSSGTITVKSFIPLERRAEAVFRITAVDKAATINKANVKGNFACNYQHKTVH